MEKYQTLLPYRYPFLYSPLSPFAFPGRFRGCLLCCQDTDVAEKWKKSGCSHEPMPLFAVPETKRDPKFPRQELQPFKFWDGFLLRSCKTNAVSCGYLLWLEHGSLLRSAQLCCIQAPSDGCCTFPYGFTSSCGISAFVLGFLELTVWEQAAHAPQCW